ncbi:MAG: M20/M25/M40 family metallo-hydrolase [Chloroflexi bacterium]|nr:M20/M25/M40 family metallo-hydrolase [Chloroflexota bacterium]
MVETQRIVEWLTQLVQIPSVGPANAGARSGPCSEARLAEQVAAWFRAFGGHVEQEEVFPGRPNVYGVWRGAGDRWLAVDAHLDTVSVETMEGDPFDGRVADGRVYGRGSVDTKATIAILLTLLESIHTQGVTLPFNLVVCGTADEETGAYGAGVFRDWVRRKGFSLHQLIVGEPTLCAPVHGHKGSVGLILEITGSAAHSSRPEQGRNAITAAVPVISAMMAEHQRLIEEEPTSSLGTGTLSVTMIRGGQAHNIIPDRCTINVDRRLTAGEDPAEEGDRILTLAMESCPLPLSAEKLHGLHPFYQDPASPLVQQLSAWTGRAPGVAPYASNAWAYGGLAEEVVLFGPGSIEQAHRDVEWVEISELEKAAQIYMRWWGLMLSDP